MTDENKPHINLGYPLAQLQKALLSTGDQAQKHVTQWQSVLQGIMNGTLKIGSRTPVADTPGWVTLEISHGGFATGNFAAGGPLSPYETRKLKLLAKAQGGSILMMSTISPSIGRSALNSFFAGDLGSTELAEQLANGSFQIQVPEEAALLIAIWLMKNNQRELAEKLIETILPFFEQLRFFPEPTTTPARTRVGEYMQTAGESVKALLAKRQQKSILIMNEALTVWAPLYDRIIQLFLDTVDGDTPTFQKDSDNKLERAANGQPIVIGGWPCRHYPKNWIQQADKLLQDYETARTQNRLSKKHLKRKENFAQLRTGLAKAIKSPKSLTGQEVGMIRKILASFVSKHGAPGSERLRKTRSMQQSIAQTPLHSILAKTLANRLKKLPPDEGVPNITGFLGPLNADEAAKINTEEGKAFPKTLISKAMRCLEAPLESLVERRLVPSSEAMAKVLPLLTARILASAIDDKELARVVDAAYRAFRQRRSALLLNYESQVRFEELPWISAIQQWMGSNQLSKTSACEALTQASILAIETFPQTIIPNKLMKEFRALFATAQIQAPLVDELAADIFMGSFSSTYVQASKVAAKVLKFSLYERYYGIDYAAILQIEDLQKVASGAYVSKAFAHMCEQRASTINDTSTYSVARNGMIIEQSQILTTHNLAVLFSELDLVEKLRPKLPKLVEDCFHWVCRELQYSADDWRTELSAIKNAAYAWRQMIFYLSLIEPARVDSTLAACTEHLIKQPEAFQKRFEPAMNGLLYVSRGAILSDNDAEAGVQRFLGWTTSRHWLRTS